MDIDNDRIRDRLRYIREQVGVLEPLAGDDAARSARLQDPLSFSGIVRHLQTSVEAMIDIAFHLCAKLYAREPQSAAHAFELLAERGDLPREFLPTAIAMVRFRNLVVHGYLSTSSDEVERIVIDRLPDFIAWEGIVKEIAHRQGGHAKE